MNLLVEVLKMPPSPVMRVSPGRGLKVENHRRGRSLESGIVYRHKEDDLALFNEVRNKERDGFLLQSNDNFDDFFSKFLIPPLYASRFTRDTLVMLLVCLL